MWLNQSLSWTLFTIFKDRQTEQSVHWLLSLNSCNMENTSSQKIFFIFPKDPFYNTLSNTHYIVILPFKYLSVWINMLSCTFISLSVSKRYAHTNKKTTKSINQKLDRFPRKSRSSHSKSKLKWCHWVSAATIVDCPLPLYADVSWVQMFLWMFQFWETSSRMGNKPPGRKALWGEFGNNLINACLTVACYIMN